MKILKILVNTGLFLLLTLIASAFELDGEVDRRQFNQEKIAEFQSDPSFDYSTEYAQSDSILGLIILYFLDKLNSIFRSMGMDNTWPYLLTIVALAVVVTLIYYILKNRYGSVLERERKNFMPVGVTAVDGQRVDYNQLIDESRKNGDYKLAIRYVFLKCLNELSRNDQIKITSWKAPMDYVDELPEMKQTSFSDLVNLFELTWYGDYQVDSQQCDESVHLAESVCR